MAVNPGIDQPTPTALNGSNKTHSNTVVLMPRNGQLSDKSHERERRVPVGEEVEPGFHPQNPAVSADDKIP
jgi:hypothetical protein